MAETFPIPENPHAEQSLVSSVWAGLLQGDGVAQRALFDLEPAAFMVPQARVLWTAFRAISEQGEAVRDPVVIFDTLKRLKLDSVVGGLPGIQDALGYQEWAQPEPLVRILRELHGRRTLISSCADISRKARDLTTAFDQTVSDMSTAAYQINCGNGNVEVDTAEDLMHHLIHARKPLRDVSKGDKLFWFPFDTWNDAIECAPGHVIIVGAAPKTGKTALAIDSMVHTTERGGSTALISLEMDRAEVGSRVAARWSGYNSRKFLREEWGPYVGEAAARYQEASKRMFWWCHPSGVPWARVEGQIRELVRLRGVRSVVIDYFTLIGKPSGQKGASDASLWGALSMAIKRLAQELQICIVLLCQLNREGAEGEPHKHNLRETGQLEQDANAITFLWKEKEDGPVFGKVSENRSGPVVSKRELRFDGATNTFTVESKTTASPAALSGWK